MGVVNLFINDKQVTADENCTILEAACQAGIFIPTLCHHPEQEVKANCRICVVEVEGRNGLVPSCATRVTDGMKVKTDTPWVREARKTLIELILAHHDQDCSNCFRDGKCELQALAVQYGVKEIPWPKFNRDLALDESSPALIRDPNKCILCGRCVDVCGSGQSVYALGIAHRGFNALIVPSLEHDLFESPCVMCGQCIHACPVGAIYERDQTKELLAAISDNEKIVVAQIAPAVRLALSEEFGQAPGTMPISRLVGGLKQIGIDYVFPTSFTADLTIMEEGNEFLSRLEENRKLPIITSCSPGWVTFCETYFPDLLDHLSTCKSPQQMFGTLAKTYWAEKMCIEPSKIFSVSFMPCTAKKYEAIRPEMMSSGYRDVDLVLTTRELARLFRMTNLDPYEAPDTDFDNWIGEYTGAGVIFGATGGVAEAALRTVYELKNGQPLDNIEFREIRGLKGIKETEVTIGNRQVKVAVAHGLTNARMLMNEIRKGTSPYDFIEIMACPGGCVGGGGQPITKDSAMRNKRIDAIYEEEISLSHRKSHQNSDVMRLYQEYLGYPLSDKCHSLLHTEYKRRYRPYL